MLCPVLRQVVQKVQKISSVLGGNDRSFEGLNAPWRMAQALNAVRYSRFGGNRYEVVVVEMKSILPLLLALVGLVACQSKQEEPAPAGVMIEGLPLKARMEQKAKIDSRIDEIQRAAKKIKTIIETFRQMQSPGSDKDPYTPVDFLIDMGRELHMQLPMSGPDGKLTRKANMKIPILGIVDACRVVGVQLESETLFAEKSDKNKPSGEKITYSIKTCRSQEQYIPVLEASWNDSNFEFRLINKSLESIFMDLFVKDLGKNATCKIVQSQDGDLDSVSCESFQLALSQTERAMVKKLAYYGFGAVRFEFAADLLENGIKKAEPELKVMADGKPVFNPALLPVVEQTENK